MTSTSTNETTSGELAAFRPLCDIATELGAKVPPSVRRAFLVESGELLDKARELHAPRWIVRQLREQCGRAHVLAYLAASN